MHFPFISLLRSTPFNVFLFNVLFDLKCIFACPKIDFELRFNDFDLKEEKEGFYCKKARLEARIETRICSITDAKKHLEEVRRFFMSCDSTTDLQFTVF